MKPMIALAELVCLLGVTSIVMVCGESEVQFSDEAWLNHDYYMKWVKVGESLLVEVQVRTTGYIGWGVSPQGAMIGADIAIMWVDDTGIAHIQDFHGGSYNGAPIRDASQDYEHLQGSRNDTHTIVRFTRLLDTCDKVDDITIISGPMRFIWAYGIPVRDISGRQLNVYYDYHGRNRGSKSLILQGGYGRLEQRELPQDASTWDILMPQVTIPHNDHTTYWCQLVKVPDLQEKNHIIQAEPVIHPGNERYIHHILVYGCTFPEDVDVELHPAYAELSTQGSMCDLYQRIRALCISEVVATWAVGGQSFWFPDETGFPIGGDSELKYIMMEMHYDNPEYTEGQVDSSGIRLWYTPNLREYDSSTLVLGSKIGPLQIIPPNMDEFITYAYCSKNCTEVIPENGLTVFSGLLHAHTLGKKIITRHIRNGQELPPIMTDEYFDFNYQDNRPIEPKVTIYPGDEFVVECHYDSSDRSSATFGGASTQHEMCLSFLSYYPATGLRWCLSEPSTILTTQTLNIPHTNALVYELTTRPISYWDEEKCEQLQLIARNAFTAICLGPAFGPLQCKGSHVRLKTCLRRVY